VRLSISARVSIACTSVIVMALALLAVGFSVGDKIHRADLRITVLSDALARQDRLDQAQRRLRQDVGRLTRDAERGIAVRNARWEALHNRIATFKRHTSRNCPTADWNRARFQGRTCSKPPPLLLRRPIV